MAKIIIKGGVKYVKRLSAHLLKEHPTTKRRMKVCGVKKKR
jgi:hypothetical protein